MPPCSQPRSHDDVKIFCSRTQLVDEKSIVRVSSRMMTVRELKAKLQSRGLSMSGGRKELVLMMMSKYFFWNRNIEFGTQIVLAGFPVDLGDRWGRLCFFVANTSLVTSSPGRGSLMHRET